ncbi:glutamyl-Q tRNA(Asp) synthetase [Marinobacterium nitratireducens]|uniref:Glutamyl-Q tRNA(Asp) synthetase n=1 Tax=Marinobacterium nitratireducens TaxID=518897 RepID=A0A918DX17_9GAMM|nr:tRNA glutamyl-Q(34) synthetase GluQRS [Marinobacterium nitratireducens]GGO88569.1 glutamyl-Q tRNA(Asp) synthetase [Marinobacterium nitratireducens]
MHYIGRFAPSPTGPLHFGSLLAALASYADARANQGLWLVRIEDLDPPREQPGASQQILATLESFGFEWDGEVRFQSRRLAAYRNALQRLLDNRQAYYCSCSRKRLQQRTGGSRYDGYCLVNPPDNADDCAIRAHCEAGEIVFDDSIQGPRRYRLSDSSGDFVIRRRDGFFAYQLAVVVDDADQGITHIVRGSDLLDETPRQIQLQRYLGLPRPRYSHIPVAAAPDGQKLSKQTRAAPLDDSRPQPALMLALDFLGQQPDAALRDSTPGELLQWAVDHWQPHRVPPMLSQPAPLD